MYEITKELKDISWNVSEETYRQDPALSYSTLSTYEKVGYNGLDHLFDRKESPSLVLGSAVDSIITGGEDEFNARFLVLDINVTDSGKDVCNQLLQMFSNPPAFEDIPETIVSDAAKAVGFWKDDKWDNRRYKEVLKTGNIAEYFNALASSDKTIIDSETYQDALACVRALREAPATCGYFADDDEMSPIRRYYQLKFKAKFGNVVYRNMADLIVVNYENKKVFPIDLKTAFPPEWDFEGNFVTFHYYTQARLYWRIIRANMDADPYFKDFSLEDYRFIVVNKKTLTPLVWEFPLTKEAGTLVDDKGGEHLDPFEIGEELQAYLNLRPPVPNGINKDGINIITCLKKKDENQVQG